jgi:hypothetical protein
MTPCLNCHTRPARARGRCHTCYTYLHTTGNERPVRLITRSPRHCQHCGGGPVKAAGRCAACYVYFHETGRDRPRYLWDPDANCKNPACLRPLRCDPHARFGYCAACYLYRRRNGQQRPARLTGGPGPWCDCGARATRQVEVRVGVMKDKQGREPVMLDLCEACFMIEAGERVVKAPSVEWRRMAVYV